jgi:hypothetical protein
MSALRRDLLERRWWVLVAVLVVCVVAVPLLLLTQAPASGARVDAPSGVVAPVPVQASGRGTAAKPTPSPAAGLPRDPFTSATPKLAAKPAAPARTPATSSTVASNPVLVAPTPAAASSPSSVSTSTPATGSGSTQGNSTVTGTTTTTTTTDPPPSVQASTPPITRSWTIYAVDLRLGKDAHARVRRNLARLTLLPTPKDPELMFIGVMAGGRQAVFALAAGVQHRGRGRCKPSHQVCSTIVLNPGQTELLTVPTTAGEEQQLTLSLIAVRSRVTQSRSAALAAYERESAAGQCDLNLAEPMSYGQSLGTLSAAAGGSCRHQPTAVPFPFVAQSQ